MRIFYVSQSVSLFGLGQFSRFLFFVSLTACIVLYNSCFMSERLVLESKSESETEVPCAFHSHIEIVSIQKCTIILHFI